MPHRVHKKPAARGKRIPPHPKARPKVSRIALVIAALIIAVAWFGSEQYLGNLTPPHYVEMLDAATRMRMATRVVREQKQAMGIMQDRDVDPNQTGLIGPDWSESATTLGSVESKRTATNPDLAAVIVKEIAPLPDRGDGKVVLSVSGSFVGGDIAALAAVEALAAPTVIFSSQGASTFGATDLNLTWLDIEAAIREAGVFSAKSQFAVLGGDGGIGSNMFEEGRTALSAAAEKYSIPLLSAESLAELIDEVFENLLDAAGGEEHISAFINVGGSAVALGNCPEAETIPNGLIRSALPCTARSPGLIGRMLEYDIPVFHILNLNTFAAEHGLPFDPVPLPRIGDNKRVYGGAAGRQ